MEEVGLLRETSDPSGAGVWSLGVDSDGLDHPFTVYGEPAEPPSARSGVSAALLRSPSLDAPWAEFALLVALMGLLLVPLLGLTSRYVNRKPLFGCEIKALASKACPA